MAAVNLHEKPRFEAGLEAVHRRFEGGILALDGSSLDRVARRLRVLRRDRRVPKRAILHRKNSLFYKTQNGARAGDLFMSLIATARLAAADPFHYLTELLRRTRPRIPMFQT